MHADRPTSSLLHGVHACGSSLALGCATTWQSKHAAGGMHAGGTMARFSMLSRLQGSSSVSPMQRL